MSELSNVRWVIFKGGTGADEVETPIADFMTKEELLTKLESKSLTLPEVKEGEELCLVYDNKDEEVFIGINNQTSDVESERFKYSTDSYIVLESVKADTDYVMDYNDEKLSAEDEGRELTQEEYVAAQVA